MNTIQLSETLKIAALFFGGLILFAACTDVPERKQTVIATIVDMTEEMQARPTVEEIFPLFGLEEDKWNGAQYIQRSLTDVSVTPRIVQTLAPGGNRLRSSSYTRDTQVLTFKDSVAHAIEGIKADTVGHEQSSVYLPLAETLNSLAESTAEQRIVLVYSDMLEHTSRTNFYSKKTFVELKTQPEKVKVALLSQAPLKRLDGITVYIVNSPKNPKSDELFRVSSTFFKSFLSDHGATVHIVANLAGVTPTTSK